MSNRTRILVSAILIMAGGMFCAAAVTSAILYKLEFDEQRDHLMEIARGQARFMEAVARFDAIHTQDDHPGGARAATLSQITAAHEHYPGFGETGELVVAQREGDQIVFLFPHRHGGGSDPDPIPWASELAEPVRQALSGQAGTLGGLGRGDLSNPGCVSQTAVIGDRPTIPLAGEPRAVELCSRWLTDVTRNGMVADNRGIRYFT